MICQLSSQASESHACFNAAVPWAHVHPGRDRLGLRGRFDHEAFYHGANDELH